ncbi:3-isopropylmalate dehydrogenase [Thermosporothrix hazakensis]|uniref:3-isopropylmalate dehydrogenase n=2 Tax=Thermosporothrix TaxID=768650 RepID=A0A326U6N1_THEHA|nr:3-isopropylmalate dehydrogenase [Thermosporothrix hazakensis]PZW30463.1 3-isopropylmalate dehydrogenase [Thermosporothrix hazakensis]BBH91178.1 3-isopropylmalate dehydrogenase [Thermosporothrix sp. COM3]GCE49323.1 3-isopropylmalate dehydrogenase [Thermosporothrix hazakensis]
MGNYTITVLAGDGIGPEVTAQAEKVLETVAQLYGHTFTFQRGLVGLTAIEAEGAAISDETVALCEQSDAILFGAVGGATPGAKVKPEQALFRLRKGFQFFANLRPVHTFQALLNASTIKPEVLQGTDLIVVRELTGGLYYGHLEPAVPGKPSEIRQTERGTEAIDTLLYTEEEIERIVRVAFEIARGRRKKVTSVDKANVLSSSVLWRRVAERVAAEYPDVTFEHLLVDACAMHLLRQPSSFDVIVTENLFGDILTDEASMLAGSMGMLPSASLGTRRTAHGTFGLYEPIHGSAPDIAGQDKANPLAAILSAAMLLRHSLGLEHEATVIEKAVERCIDEGYRTADLRESGKEVIGTKEMGNRVIETVKRIAQEKA